MIKLNAREKATRCTRREAALLKCDLATNGDARMLQLRAVALKLFIRVLLSRSGILHDAQSKHCANYSPVSHWSPDLDNSCHEFSTLLPPSRPTYSPTSMCDYIPEIPLRWVPVSRCSARRIVTDSCMRLSGHT